MRDDDRILGFRVKALGFILRKLSLAQSVSTRHLRVPLKWFRADFTIAGITTFFS